MANANRPPKKKYRPKPPVNNQKKDFISELCAIRDDSKRLLLSALQVRALVKDTYALYGDQLDVAKINTLTSVLGKDVSALNVELETLTSECNAKIQELSNSPNEMEVMTTSIDLANGFESWQQKFTDTTLGIVDSITQECGRVLDECKEVKV